MSHVAHFMIGIGLGFAAFHIYGRWFATKKTKAAIFKTYNMSRDERMKNGGPY